MSKSFGCAAKSLSFTRAAEVCHVSQPALTTSIKKLEEQLGSPLFHREGRQITLTEFGRRMQPHLSQIVEQARAAETVAKDFRLLKALIYAKGGHRERSNQMRKYASSRSSY